MQHKVAIVIPSLGAMPEIVEAVHGYGGLMFHDVINVHHGQKAAAAGVGGFIALCSGAGGHDGTLNPMAFVGELREFFHKTLLVGGCFSTGSDITAVELMGAGLDPDHLAPPDGIDFGQELTDSGEPNEQQGDKKTGAWRDCWSANRSGPGDYSPELCAMRYALCAMRYAE